MKLKVFFWNIKVYVKKERKRARWKKIRRSKWAIKRIYTSKVRSLVLYLFLNRMMNGILKNMKIKSSKMIFLHNNVVKSSKEILMEE
jgi:hypothetical protein